MASLFNWAEASKSQNYKQFISILIWPLHSIYNGAGAGQILMTPLGTAIKIHFVIPEIL